MHLNTPRPVGDGDSIGAALLSERGDVMSLVHLTCALVGLAACGCVANPEIADSVSEELKETLTLRVEQGGIAGTNVITWEISPSGKWRVISERPKAKTEELSGTLSQDQLERVAKELHDQNIHSLPDKIGEESKVNPSKLVLKYGTKESVVFGMPTRRLDRMKSAIESQASKDERHGEDLRRIATLVELIVTNCR
jgi:hypothetical protein